MGGRLSRRTNERRGEDNIVEALAVQFPDMFHAEILSKLGLEDTLTLSQVSKKCWREVWSEAGVRRMKAMTDDLAKEKVRPFSQAYTADDVAEIGRQFGALKERALEALSLRGRLGKKLHKIWKSLYCVRINMIVARHKEGLPPFVETPRRWQRDGGPSRLERVMMSNWFNYAFVGLVCWCTAVILQQQCVHIYANWRRLIALRVLNHDVN